MDADKIFSSLSLIPIGVYRMLSAVKKNIFVGEKDFQKNFASK
jgi:hypothetical protein